MKKSILKLSVLLALLAVGISSCGDDDDGPTLNDLQLRTNELEATWAVSTFTLPDPALTSDYSDLEVTITGNDSELGGGTFVTQNGSPLFAASGTWSFEGDSENTLIFTQSADANVRILVNSVTETTLSIEVEATDPDNGRITTIFGNYTFELEKQ